jgi:hypothetical protein
MTPDSQLKKDEIRCCVCGISVGKVKLDTGCITEITGFCKEHAEKYWVKFNK